MQTTRVINQVAVTYNSTGPKKGNMKNWKMTDDLKEKLIAVAKQDAAKGVYGSQEFKDLQYNEIEKVAPNRSGLMAKATSLQRQHGTTAANLIGRKKGTVREWVEKMLGTGFGGETIKSDGPNMHIYDEYGDEILTYDSYSGWHEGQSREETNVYSAFKDVYYQAFTAAEQEMKASHSVGTQVSSNGIDVKI